MVYDFAITRNHRFKEGFDILLTFFEMNQNDINNDYICSNPS